ncbi:YodC family protein [Vibrio vulnificus]|uniref:YodC family protein n=1 Tax=Vibrionaceae TaxID=641 RepID=UPI00296CEB4D|nr:DUF2158 domain-containing protein [Photobacterium leiognathi]ELU4011425.1 DUF2158 domain-containing protein [Vibrio vulnificus]
MNEDNMYEVGKIVTLKSGGPTMTIKSEERDYHENWKGTYECQWFAGKKLERGVFPHDSLVVVED